MALNTSVALHVGNAFFIRLKANSVFRSSPPSTGGRSAPELRNQRLLERFLFDEREPPRRVELQDARPLPVLAKMAPHMLRVVLIRIYI